MRLNDRHLRQLNRMVRAWLKERDIDSGGREVFVVAMGQSNRITNPRPLNAKDWKEILGFPLKRDLIAILMKLKKRQNDGLVDGELGISDIAAFAQRLNVALRNCRSKYRMSCALSGTSWRGPWKMCIQA